MVGGQDRASAHKTLARRRGDVGPRAKRNGHCGRDERAQRGEVTPMWWVLDGGRRSSFLSHEFSLADDYGISRGERGLTIQALYQPLTGTVPSW